VPVKTSVWIIGVICVALAIFTLHPAIMEARNQIPPGGFDAQKFTCSELFKNRPWYGTFNYWFWAMLALPAFMIAMINPAAPQPLRIIKVIAAIFIFYILLNLSNHLSWDIRNAQIMSHEDPRHPGSGYRMDCIDTGDGASLAFALLFGWIPGLIYVGWCLMAWRKYHETLGRKFTYNIIELIAVRCSQGLSILLCGYIAFAVYRFYFS